MNWNWGNIEVSIPIQFDTESIFQEQINAELLRSPTAQTYYEIARYYQEQGLNFIEALRFVDSVIDMGGDTYYFHRVRSLILADLKKYEAAIKASNISIVLAEKEGKDEFVRLNQNDILKWKTIQKNK